MLYLFTAEEQKFISTTMNEPKPGGEHLRHSNPNHSRAESRWCNSMNFRNTRVQLGCIAESYRERHVGNDRSRFDNISFATLIRRIEHTDRARAQRVFKCLIKWNWLNPTKVR